MQKQNSITLSDAQNFMGGGTGNSLPRPDKARIYMLEAIQSTARPSATWATTNVGTLQEVDSGAGENHFDPDATHDARVEFFGFENQERVYLGDFFWPFRHLLFLSRAGAAYVGDDNGVGAMGRFTVGFANELNIFDAAFTGVFFQAIKDAAGDPIPFWYAFVVFNGAIVGQVRSTVQASSGPFGTSPAYHDFKIDIVNGIANFAIDGIVFASIGLNAGMTALGPIFGLNSENMEADDCVLGAEYIYAEGSTI